MLRPLNDPRPSSGPLPRRILMTVDAVGGVWRHAIEAARELGTRGTSVVLAGLGPDPLPGQIAEARALARTDLVWLDAPLDWTVESEAALDALPRLMTRLVDEFCVDLVHLNAPSQAVGLTLDCPIVVMSHSCVVTWWDAVRSGPLPEAWTWQQRRNRAGLDAADAVLAPTAAHAAALRRVFGDAPNLAVVPNAARPGPRHEHRRDVVFAAGRWWDDGKNGALLDDVARRLRWPVEMAGALSGPGGTTFTARHAELLGPLSPTGVREAMASAAVFACPSLYEPFGLVALEAAHAGAALVLADIPTFREIWADAALYADPRDPAAYAFAIERAMEDEALRRDLADRAAARAALFTPARQGDALLAIYAACLHRRGGRKVAAE